MSTCCIALDEPVQIRGSISKMKMDIQKKKWTVMPTKYVLTEAFVHTGACTERQKN